MLEDKDSKATLKEILSEFQRDDYVFERKNKSIKQLLRGIYQSVSYLENKHKEEEYDKKWGIDGTINSLAIVAFFMFLFATGHKSDSDFVEGLKFPSYILSVLFSVIWIGVQLERITFFRELWAFNFTKLVVSISITGLIVFCSSIASSLINSVFGVDPSLFPFSRSFLTALVFFKYMSPLVIVLVLTSFFHLIPIYAYLKGLREDGPVNFPFNSVCFIFFTIVFGSFTWKWLENNFNDSVMNDKVYLLARFLDFNDNNACHNLKERKVGVLFLGQNQNQVLVDYNNLINSSNLEFFVEGKFHGVFQRSDFKILPCMH
ncbi:hypothetical protein ACQV2B_05330 [Pantoea allii]|uniref:hypothetical protein n=1 Tax=Pantoea allii TaxID=574096 RepID=UPI003D322479